MTTPNASTSVDRFLSVLQQSRYPRLKWKDHRFNLPVWFVERLSRVGLFELSWFAFKSPIEKQTVIITPLWKLTLNRFLEPYADSPSDCELIENCFAASQNYIRFGKQNRMTIPTLLLREVFDVEPYQEPTFQLISDPRFLCFKIVLAAEYDEMIRSLHL